MTVAKRSADPAERCSLLAGWLCMILAAVMSGCGRGDAREFQLSGAVTIGGVPVPRGYVLFDPDASAGQDGQQGYAEIVDGRYSTATGKKGVTGGRYVARVNGFTAPDPGGRPTPLVRDFAIPLELTPDVGEVDLDIPAEAKATKPAPLAPPI